MEVLEDGLLILVDDEKDLVSELSGYFVSKGYRVKSFFDGRSVMAFLEKSPERPDLIVLDLTLPDMDGFEVCRKIRESERFPLIPIIILSGKSSESDKIAGLDIGADDYVVKPFSPDELDARVRAVIRRRQKNGLSEKMINAGGLLEIDFKTYRVKVNDSRVELTPVEFKVLECLLSRKGQAFTRGRILSYLWGEEKIVVGRTVDVHIRHLREKLGEAGKYIKNVRGVGYIFDEERSS
jgi:two-component system phosphate regulon response regulator PhoB/two-component system alkaline phosphatase synthesis response regulator PhoP